MSSIPIGSCRGLWLAVRAELQVAFVEPHEAFQGHLVAVTKGSAVHAVSAHGQEVVRSRREEFGHCRRDSIHDPPLGDGGLARRDLSGRVDEVDERQIHARFAHQFEPPLGVPPDLEPAFRLQRSQDVWNSIGARLMSFSSHRVVIHSLHGPI